MLTGTTDSTLRPLLVASKVRAKCIPQVPPIKATKGSRSAERIRAIERAKKEVELSLNRKELIAKMLAWQPIVEP